MSIEIKGQVSMEATPGTSLEHAVRDSIDFAKKHNAKVFLRFNGQTLAISPSSIYEDITALYWQRVFSNEPR